MKNIELQQRLAVIREQVNFCFEQKWTTMMNNFAAIAPGVNALSVVASKELARHAHAHAFASGRAVAREECLAPSTN